MDKNLTTKQDIINVLQPLFATHDRYQVLKDWFSLMANSLFLAASVAGCGEDGEAPGAKEAADAFGKVYNSYTSEEKKALDEAFDKLIQWMTEEMESGTYRDWLGEIYMESCTASKEKAQHFTPYCVGKLCAEMTCSLEQVKKDIAEKGFTTFSDPCVGAGCLPIAFCDVLRENGINYQSQAVIAVGDNDQRCVDMTYIQMTLIGACAIVENRDALTMECKQSRKTYMLIMKEKEGREMEKWKTAFQLIDGATSAKSQKPDS